MAGNRRVMGLCTVLLFGIEYDKDTFFLVSVNVRHTLVYEDYLQCTRTLLYGSD